MGLVEFDLIWAVRMWKFTSMIEMWKNIIGASQQVLDYYYYYYYNQLTKWGYLFKNITTA